MKQFDVYFINPKSPSSGRQTIRIQADSHFNAKRIFVTDQFKTGQ
jgi:hypothetical protein